MIEAMFGVVVEGSGRRVYELWRICVGYTVQASGYGKLGDRVRAWTVNFDAYRNLRMIGSVYTMGRNSQILLNTKPYTLICLTPPPRFYHHVYPSAVLL